MFDFKRFGILAQLHSYRENTPHHFWLGSAVAGISLFAGVAAFATAPATSLELPVEQKRVVETLELKRTVLTTSRPELNIFIREERMRPGDTFASLLHRMAVQDNDAVSHLRQDRSPLGLAVLLRPGVTVTARTNEFGRLLSLAVPLADGERERLLSQEDGLWRVRDRLLELENRTLMRSAEIKSSFFAAADSVGLPDAAAKQLADIFANDLDFADDLKTGDRFSVVYEMQYSRGEPVRTGRVLAAEISHQGVSYKALAYPGSDGKLEYYTPEGRPLKKAFLRTPLEVSRISSGFTSERFHPFLHSWRAHKGVDLSAPIGTGVKATADGVVDVAGRQGGYGNVVILKHQGVYSTVYGHLSGFGPGIHAGSKVRQGDIIGYVGTTGWSTGPHLHYEFRISDEPQDPMAVALPGARPLPGSQLSGFKTRTEPMLARLNQMRGVELSALN